MNGSTTATAVCGAETEGPAPQYKPLRDYLHRVPGHRRNSRTNLSTGIRWATNGVRAMSGEVVKLRAIRFGARWMTTDVWFDEFLKAFLAATGAPTAAPTPAARNRKQAAASAELDVLLGTAGG